MRLLTGEEKMSECMKNGLWTLQIHTGQMKKMHLQMKESMYFSADVEGHQII